MKIISVDVQEDSEKELKVIMVETKTQMCLVTQYNVDIMKFQNQTFK